MALAASSATLPRATLLRGPLLAVPTVALRPGRVQAVELTESRVHCRDHDLSSLLASSAAGHRRPLPLLMEPPSSEASAARGLRQQVTVEARLLLLRSAVRGPPRDRKRQA